MRAIIYTEPGCQFCQQAKEFLSGHGIGYEERDVSTSQAAREELHRLGIQAVPVIIINDHIVVGFDVEKLAELIGE